MRWRPFVWTATGCALASLMAVAGCEATDSTATTTTDSDVAGVWQYSDSAGLQSTWSLEQATSGSGALTGSGTAGDTLTGSIDGTTVALTVIFDEDDEGTSILSGTYNSDTLSGSFTNTVSGAGSWVAVRTE